MGGASGSEDSGIESGMEEICHNDDIDTLMNLSLMKVKLMA